MIKTCRQKEIKKNMGYMFYCDECRKEVPVYTEYWKKNMDSAYKLVLIDHFDGAASIVDEIIIIEMEENENDHLYNFCTHCYNIIKEPIDLAFAYVLDQLNKGQYKS